MERRGGSAAVYGNSNLYKVDAITSISLLKWNSDESRHGGNEENPDQKGTGFARVLETEVSKTNEPKDVTVRTIGYTRLGMPASVFINMRDYTYQQ